MSSGTISAADPYERWWMPVLDTERVSLSSSCTASPRLPLSGWRSIIPHLEGLSRYLAPDLVSMGRSGMVPNCSFRFVDHARYLDTWFATQGL